MHSGSVGAGMRRGDKTRFQFYADTICGIDIIWFFLVLLYPASSFHHHTSQMLLLSHPIFSILKMTTTSRTESTGVPGRIQTSVETATFLSQMLESKIGWLKEKSKVQAQGKVNFHHPFDGINEARQFHQRGSRKGRQTTI
jgi:F0F1-type ATP synthase membrane subunit a